MAVKSKSRMDAKAMQISELTAWRTALQTPRPFLAHLNADTTWLLQLPIPHAEAVPSTNSPRRQRRNGPIRTRFNVLLDPWLQGPQSDVAAWFSTQWHIVAPSFTTLAELNAALAAAEGFSEAESEGVSFIDVVAISHEFTDHCHQATLLELPASTPVFATEQAATLIRSWKHFDNVVTTPAFSAESAAAGWQDTLASPLLPPWLGIGRAVTAGNALYYHSALLVVFDLAPAGTSSSGPAARTRSRRKSEAASVAGPGDGAEAVVYSPHGIQPADLECVRAAGVKTLALLHGLHDVRIWMTKQLSLGARNGLRAARVCGAKYWVATHDEEKKGGGLVSWFLQRTVYSLRDAVEAEENKEEEAREVDGEGGMDSPEYRFVELGSGDALRLE